VLRLLQRIASGDRPDPEVLRAAAQARIIEQPLRARDVLAPASGPALPPALPAAEIVDDEDDDFTLGASAFVEPAPRRA
jgi:hypothetical protein